MMFKITIKGTVNESDIIIADDYEIEDDIVFFWNDSDNDQPVQRLVAFYPLRHIVKVQNIGGNNEDQSE